MEADFEEFTDEEFFASFSRIVVASELSSATVTPSRRAAVDLISEHVATQAHQSILVVGERGVGKSALIDHAIHELGDGASRIVFRAAASDLMAGQMFIGMMEGRVQEISARARNKHVVWLLPNFEETLWAGQHLQSPRGLLDALMPSLEARAFTIVGEIDSAAFEQLAQRRPKILELFAVVRLLPPPAEESLEIANAWAASESVEASEPVLREALLLAEHYLPGLAAPGNVLRLLKGTMRDEGKPKVVSGEAVTSALSGMSGLPLHILDPRTPLSLDDVKVFLTSRVLGQPEAVECLVERVALVKAGLTDPTRPFGVFLFVGPTGTGKTELAKALAEYLFGSPDRLVRLDMSEFQTPESLERLLAPGTGHESPSAGFVSAVRQYPFSVVLLDEFEKAHENVWDVFLQVFDDGRLTDQGGKTVDFRHTVIILTSNIGSAIPTGQGLGFVTTAQTFSATSVERSVAAAFRPEFLNRLDRIVVFRPLQREIMRSLLEKELANVLGRRGLENRPWAVEWDESAIDLLIEKGFNSEQGARPLKRAIERHLLAPLAMAIVERQVPEGEQFLLISANDRSRIRVRFVDPDSDDGVTPPGPPTERSALTLREVALEPRIDASGARFLVDEFDRIGAAVSRLAAEKDEALAATRDAEFWESDERNTILARIEYLDRLVTATRTAENLARRLQNAIGRTGNAPVEVVQLLASRLYVLDCACSELDAGDPKEAILMVAGSPATAAADEALQFVRRLAQMYESWGERRGMRLQRLSAEDGFAYAVSGFAAHTILEGEQGLHALEQPTESRGFDRITARVTVTPVPIGTLPQDGEAPPSSSPPTTVVRRYRFRPSPLVRDASGWRTGRIERVLEGDFDLFR